MALIGDSVQAAFVTCNLTTGVKTAADSLPTAKLRKNGVDTGAAVTVTDRTGGVYSVSVTLSSSAPQSFAVGDTWSIEATWTMGGTSGVGCIVAQGVIRSPFALESTLTAIKGAGWTTQDLVSLYTQIGTRLATAGYTAPDNAGISAVKTVTDKVSAMIEVDPNPGGDYRWDEASLANVASAAAGVADWSATEKQQIRQALGISGTSSATSGTGNLDGVKGKTDLIPAGGPLAASDYVAPDNADIATILSTLNAIKGGGWSTQTLVAIYNQIGTRLATSGYVAPDNSSITSIKGVTDKLSLMIQGNGAGDYQFDTTALELAPGGAGTSRDFTDAEISQIRDALGISGTKVAATGGQLQAIKTVTDKFTFTGAYVWSTLNGAKVDLNNNQGTVTVGTVSSVTQVESLSTAARNQVNTEAFNAVSDIRAQVQDLHDRLTAARALLLDRLSHLDMDVSAVSAGVATAVEIRNELDANSTQLAKLGTPASGTLAGDLAALAGDVAGVATQVSGVAGDVTAVKGVTEELETMLQPDPANPGRERFTPGALANGPVSAGATAAAVREEIDAHSTQLAEALTLLADVEAKLGGLDTATLMKKITQVIRQNV